MSEVVIRAGRYYSNADAAALLERSILEWDESATYTVVLPSVQITKGKPVVKRRPPGLR